MSDERRALPAYESVTASPRTTIVGGRPPEEGAELPPVPTGLQRLLRLANVDEEFRRQLLERRAGMAALAGIELSASEREILRVIPEQQLATMARSLPPPSAERRDFLRQSARAAVLLLGGAALVGAEGCRQHPPAAPAGARPDPPPERPAHLPQPHDVRPDPVPDAAPPRPREQTPVPAGVRPAPPPLTPRPAASNEDEQAVAIGGLVAEPPPPRKDQNEMQAKGGAAPDEPAPVRPKRPNASRGIRPRRPDAGPPKTPPKTRGHSGDIPDDPF